MVAAATALAGASAGVLRFPGSDETLIAPIQLGLVTALEREYGRPLNESLSNAVLHTSVGQIIGKAGALTLVGLVPGAGNLIRGLVAATVTAGIGLVTIEQLNGGQALAAQ